MGDISMDHYEQQLYSVFKTFDVDNEEALDKPAVLDLCHALQLEERGAVLVDTLFDCPAERVTFTQFKNGLLSVLGGGESSHSPRSTSLPLSDDDSSDREVAPKLVVGSKKYGRRSRPHGKHTETVYHKDTCNKTEVSKPSMKQKRHSMQNYTDSMSSFEQNGNLDHDRKINIQQAIDLCKSLRMDRIEHQLIRNIFDSVPCVELTIGEFFNRLNMTLSMSIATTCDTEQTLSKESTNNNDESSWGPDSALTLDVVAESWECAGIEHARRLLTELGYTSVTLRASDLARSLDNELNAFVSPNDTQVDPRILILQASLALNKLRLHQSRQYAEAARAENIKLRSDLADANNRAQALAQEVDDNHAKIEMSLKSRIKLLESKHTDELRAAAADWSAEREKTSARVLKLEEMVSTLSCEESRLKSDAVNLQEHNKELSKRASLAEEKIIELEVVRESLAEQLKLLAEENHIEEKVDAIALELSSRVEELKLENKVLRDRNDELCAELEGGRRRHIDDDGRGDGEYHPPLPAMLSTQPCTDDFDQSMMGVDHGIIGHIEVVRKLQCVLESVPHTSLATDSDCESCGVLKSIITKIQDKVNEITGSIILADQVDGAEPSKLDNSRVDNVEIGTQTDSRDEQNIDEINKKYEEEKQELNDLVRELESSLDQLKIDYDKNDEYWTKKLEYEKDMFLEEQRVSDERLTSLINKITEYEQQFAPKTSPKLPTIDEKCNLEVQFNDLEEEYNNYKQQTNKQLESKDKLIEQLNNKIKSLEHKLERSEMKVNSNASSPIEYLWSQGTIQNPYKNDSTRRDYQNPAFMNGRKENDCSSEGDKRVSPIQRPARSSSAGALGEEKSRPRNMINCSELEGQLRKQAQFKGCVAGCSCVALEIRCRQLMAALRHRQMALDQVQQSAISESASLRSRVSAAETAVSRLQSRLHAADVLVKDLYLENCQLVSHHARLL